MAEKEDSKSREIKAEEFINELEKTPLERRLQEITRLPDGDIRNYWSELRIYRDKMVAALNALTDRLLDMAPVYYEGRIKIVESNCEIYYNPDKMAIDSNTIKFDGNKHGAVNHYLRMLSEIKEVKPHELNKKFSGVSNEINRNIREAYEEAVYTLRRRFKLTYQEIGKVLGKHHSSIMSAEDRMCKRLGIDPPKRNNNTKKI